MLYRIFLLFFGLCNAVYIFPSAVSARIAGEATVEARALAEAAQKATIESAGKRALHTHTPKPPNQQMLHHQPQVHVDAQKFAELFEANLGKATQVPTQNLLVREQKLFSPSADHTPVKFQEILQLTDPTLRNVPPEVFEQIWDQYQSLIMQATQPGNTRAFTELTDLIKQKSLPVETVLTQKTSVQLEPPASTKLGMMKFAQGKTFKSKKADFAFEKIRQLDLLKQQLSDLGPMKNWQQKMADIIRQAKELRLPQEPFSEFVQFAQQQRNRVKSLEVEQQAQEQMIQTTKQHLDAVDQAHTDLEKKITRTRLSQKIKSEITRLIKQQEIARQEIFEEYQEKLQQMIMKKLTESHNIESDSLFYDQLTVWQNAQDALKKLILNATLTHQKKDALLAALQEHSSSFDTFFDTVKKQVIIDEGLQRLNVSKQEAVARQKLSKQFQQALEESVQRTPQTTQGKQIAQSTSVTPQTKQPTPPSSGHPPDKRPTKKESSFKSFVPEIKPRQAGIQAPFQPQSRPWKSSPRLYSRTTRHHHHFDQKKKHPAEQLQENKEEQKTEEIAKKLLALVSGVTLDLDPNEKVKKINTIKTGLAEVDKKSVRLTDINGKK